MKKLLLSIVALTVVTASFATKSPFEKNKERALARKKAIEKFEMQNRSAATIDVAKTTKYSYWDMTTNAWNSSYATDATYANNLSNTPGNGNEYAENGNIINSEIAAPRFLPEEIEFEHVCDFDVMQQVNGFTTILGKRILNFYGLVEFINERNEVEKGFLFNLKPNGKGQWKVLKANR